MLTTPRLGMQVPQSVDQVSLGPADFTQAFTVLDQAVTWTQGTLASIPAAGLAGRRYYATDTGVELFDTGTQWIAVGSSQPVGAVMAYAGTADPVDAGGTTRWMVANARSLAQSSFPALFALIGTTFGGGGGNFNLPDLRQRFILGQAAGGTGSTFAGTGGIIDHTHNVSGHFHSPGSLGIVAGGGHQHYLDEFNHWFVASSQDPWFNFTIQYAFGNFAAVAVAGWVQNLQTGLTLTDFQGVHSHGVSGSVGNTGGPDGDNTQSTTSNNAPFLVLNHVIKVLP